MKARARALRVLGDGLEGCCWRGDIGGGAASTPRRRHQAYRRRTSGEASKCRRCTDNLSTPAFMLQKLGIYGSILYIQRRRQTTPMQISIRRSVTLASKTAMFATSERPPPSNVIGLAAAGVIWAEGLGTSDVSFWRVWQLYRRKANPRLRARRTGAGGVE